MDSKLEVKYRQENITPFWHKLPFFFRFPLRTGPLIFLACIVAASALAGLVLGAFGLLFKGILVYFGLRYGFNVLELFAKGRLEGESVDHTLWGPEKRPAKLGLVILLFIVIGITLGSWVVDSRVAKDPRAQQVIIERYKQQHAAEIAQLEREREAFYKRQGLETAPGAAPAESAEDDADANEPAPPALSASEAAPAPPEFGPSRAEILQDNRLDPSDPLWFKLLPPWYWGVMIVLSLMLPSATIVIALEDAFFKALNPAFVWHFIRSMGAAYFVLWAFFLLIAGTRQIVLTIGEHWWPVLRLPVEMGLSTYLALVLCALLGYTLYQFHQELHLDVEVDFDTHRKAGGAEAIAQAGSARAALHKAGPKEPLERKLQALLAQDKVAEAIAELKDGMRYARLDPELNTRLHGLYVRQGEPVLTLEHGQQWLTALTEAGATKESLAALRALLKIDPTFVVQDGNAILPLADIANKQGDRELAVSLVRGFDKRFPKHSDTPGIVFLAAKLMSEHGRQHEKSIHLLRALLANFPEHAVAAEAKTYLAVLERMLTKP
jgi:tetratricopeptide (TPR) repeat protein